MYYLQSRYYSPELCRFISADDTSILLATQGDLLGANLFAYCHNNPVMLSDPSGYCVANVIGAVIGLIGGAILGLAIANYFNLKGFWRGLVIGSTSAIFTVAGWFSGPIIYAAIQYIVTAAISAGTLMFNRIQPWIYQTIGFTKDWIANRATQFLVKSVEKLSYTQSAWKGISRTYQSSSLLIKTIMQSATPTFDKSLSFGLKWVVNGTFWNINSHGVKYATQGVYELVIDVYNMRIVHFLFRN